MKNSFVQIMTVALSKKVDVEMNLHAEMDVFFVLESFVKRFSIDGV